MANLLPSAHGTAYPPSQRIRSLGSEIHGFISALRPDQPIAELEAIELDFRRWLSNQLDAKHSLPNAQHLPHSLRLIEGLANIGLLRKYKPYAIKAASPAGYSIFLQRPGQGFSFQRHLESKIEIFHILRSHTVRPGVRGYVFLSTFEEWNRLFKGRDLTKWVADPSKGNDQFRKRCFVPEPGDLFFVDGPDVVHTIIGCDLEEFATSSGDRVDRLFDQNASRRSDLGLDQMLNVQALGHLPAIFPRRHVRYERGQWHPAAVAPKDTPFGRELTVALSSELRATFLEIDRGHAFGETDADQLAAIATRGGPVELDIRGLNTEWTHCITLTPGESTVIPPGLEFRLERASGSPTVVSIHTVPADVALR